MSAKQWGVPCMFGGEKKGRGVGGSRQPGSRRPPFVVFFSIRVLSRALQLMVITWCRTVGGRGRWYQPAPPAGSTVLHFGRSWGLGLLVVFYHHVRAKRGRRGVSLRGVKSQRWDWSPDRSVRTRVRQLTLAHFEQAPANWSRSAIPEYAWGECGLGGEGGVSDRIWLCVIKL